MEDLGKLILAKDFKKLPKVQKIAKSGHTGGVVPSGIVHLYKEHSPLGGGKNLKQPNKRQVVQ